MNSLLQPANQPDAHPGPDQLSAFAERALPPHEQQQTLAHLAACPDCRALVYLAQQADPIESTQAQAVAAREPRFSGWNRWNLGWTFALPAAALACLVLVTAHLRNASAPRSRMTPSTTASIQHVQAPIPTAPLEPLTSPVPILSAPPKSVRPILQPNSPKQNSQPLSMDETAIGGPVALSASAPYPQQPVASAAPAAPLALSARSTTAGSGGIIGLVTDKVGAAVPHATITATNTETGVQIKRESAANGDYSINPLQPGNYNVEVVAKGFQRLLQENVQVAPFQVAGLNPKLSVGAEGTTVTVTDAPPFLEATNATLGGMIENELYTQLPLSMNAGPRDPTQFQYLMPGVQEGPPPSSSGGLTQGVYGGSGQQNLNENYIEGIPVSNVSGQGGSSPAAKAMAASGMVTGAEDAGRSSPAQVKGLPTLPSQMPARSVVGSVGLTLAIDSAGTLFRSDDAGVTWHPVPTQWQGRAIALRLAQPRSAVQQAAAANTATAAEARQQTQTLAPPPPAFELTTDSGVIYTSSDGKTWQRK